jgi:hypothetical protein
MADTVRSLGDQAKDLLEQAASKIDDMVELAEEQEGEGGGTDPEPPDPGGGGGGGGGGSFEGIPTGPNDARFANCRPRAKIDVTSGTFEDFEINDQSGSALLGHKNFTARRFKLYGREGIRIAGANITCEDFWMEIAGSGDDHGDGIQAYTGPPPNNPPSPNVVFRRGKLIMKRGSNNCGLFCADNAQTGLILEDFEIEDQAGCPHGAIWFPNRPNDTGLFEIGYRRCNFKGVTHMPAGIDYSGNGAVKPKILFWEDVWCNGSEVARPY